MIDSTLTAVLTPDKGERDPGTGRFQPGNQAGRGYGRPKRSQEEQLLTAIKASMPPERIQATLAEALQIARSTNSWRGLLAVSEFAANYALGKPVARVESGGGGLAAVLAELDDIGDDDDDDEEDDGD